MIQAIPEAAFSPLLSPDGLWRAARTWATGGYEEQGEWLEQMAVTLLDINGLPEARAIQNDPHVRFCTGGEA